MSEVEAGRMLVEAEQHKGEDEILGCFGAADPATYDPYDCW